jgi:hypothetical protein
VIGDAATDDATADDDDATLVGNSHANGSPRCGAVGGMVYRRARDVIAYRRRCL